MNMKKNTKEDKCIRCEKKDKIKGNVYCEECLEIVRGFYDRSFCSYAKRKGI